MILGLHHVAIIASGEASIDFYKRLGFTETYRKERRADTVVLMQGFGIELEIFIDASHPRRACHPENLGLRMLALKVTSCKEISRQFDCGPIMQDWFGLNYCLTFDLDGQPIQLHE